MGGGAQGQNLQIRELFTEFRKFALAIEGGGGSGAKFRFPWL